MIIKLNWEPTSVNTTASGTKGNSAKIKLKVTLKEPSNRMQDFIESAEERHRRTSGAVVTHEY
ncbi:CLUMA_CG019275, isoform A [Clunio marinus]|uniref:CLUMA_CG019275, isoform A n=1 Tax=Clunio marinus TaxID=568069 RepID=A0A1J1J3E2_9DIPT|nr:CLUMA_CG019275, isoform A [Clunio marinus]